MAARKSPLRSVKPDEKAPAKKAKPVNVAAAVQGGDLREQLVAMQERIATAIDDPNIRGADLASLSRRLHELTKEIAAIDAASTEDGDGVATPDEEWSAI